jgi:hypothetical protein
MRKEESFVEKENTFHCSADATRQDGNNGNEDEVICALVLAGGEGKRLQPFIKSLGKGTLPPRLEGSRRPNDKKLAIGYRVNAKLPFDGDSRIPEVAIQK